MTGPIRSHYAQARWSLTDLFPAADSPQLLAAFTQLEAEARAFETWRPRVKVDITKEEFLELVRYLERIVELAQRVDAFAGLWFAEDTQNQAAQSLVAKVDQFMAQLRNRTLFFELWWKGLAETDAARLMAEASDYRYWLEEMRHFKPYTLSEPEERVINLKDVTGASALHTLYDMLTNRYVFKLEVDGQLLELTRDGLMMYARHHRPELRAAAYQELYRVYAQDGPILGHIYQSLVRDWRNEQLELRGFTSPIAARNLANDLPDEVVHTLLEVCRQNSALFVRFFRLKAAWLGMERLRRYDIYAPVVEADKTYAFGTAVDLVLDAFERFAPIVREMAHSVLAAHHLDSEVRPGKRSGAFCSSPSPRLTPWVLVNYQGRAHDIATLAHELGHAVHALAACQRNVFSHHAALPLAETASTFGEMLLIDRLLSSESDQAVRRDLLFRQLDDAYATILRQAYFALFECQAHDMVGRDATLGELCAAYLENLRSHFGDAVAVSDEFGWEWISIPHFYHVPFYVYAYAFGQLLVLSLYRQYKMEGSAFVPRFLSILSAGRSAAPATILAEAGIDIRQPEFWQGGFNVVREMLEQLEALPRPELSSLSPN